VRQLVRAAVVAAALMALALADLSTAKVARTAGTGHEPGTGGVVRKIHRFQRATWGWQRLIGVPRTPSKRRYLRTSDRRYRLHALRQWRRRAIRARHRAHNPPREQQWRCLQRHEGSWRDASDPYWGGLQMDRTFMRQYAPPHLLRRGWANRWSPVEQMWVAERAFRAGRGFSPWPHAARICGLI